MSMVSILSSLTLLCCLLNCHAFVGSGLLRTRPASDRPLLCLRSVAAPDAGAQIFSANCAACHAGGQNAIVADRSLEKAAIEKYLTGGFNEKSMACQVTHGDNTVPFFAERLSNLTMVGLMAVYVVNSAVEGWD